MLLFLLRAPECFIFIFFPQRVELKQLSLEWTLSITFNAVDSQERLHLKHIQDILRS